ncbi:MAG: hypothetical protein ACKVWV_15755 [Planctomycetota bacterium]
MLLVLSLALAPLARAAHPAAIPTRAAIVCTEAVSTARHSLEEILDAIRVTESGGHEHHGRDATGDGGRAIGPFQIHKSHWQDSRMTGRFDDCRDLYYARCVVIAYWQRWCPDALARRDAEVLARVHNGGPNGASKETTLKYWARVQRALAAR